MKYKIERRKLRNDEVPTHYRVWDYNHDLILYIPIKEIPNLDVSYSWHIAPIFKRPTKAVFVVVGFTLSAKGVVK